MELNKVSELPKEYEYLCLGKIPEEWVETVKQGYDPLFFNVETNEIYLSREPAND